MVKVKKIKKVVKRVVRKELQELYRVRYILGKVRSSFNNPKKRKENLKELNKVISELNKAKKHDKKIINLAKKADKTNKRLFKEGYGHNVTFFGRSINYGQYFLKFILKIIAFIKEARERYKNAKTEKERYTALDYIENAEREINTAIMHIGYLKEYLKAPKKMMTYRRLEY